MKSTSSGMVMPLALVLCSLFAVLVLSMQQLNLQQPGLIQARLDTLRQREWAWVGLRAALIDVHAPRIDVRHPTETEDAASLLANSLPATVSQWRRWWSKALPQQCNEGICVDLQDAHLRATWVDKTSGITLNLATWTQDGLVYWIEPLLLNQDSADVQLVFRITVRSGPQVWQGWWRPTAPLSTPQPQGEWLSLLPLEDA